MYIYIHMYVYACIYLFVRKLSQITSKIALQCLLKTSQNR